MRDSLFFAYSLRYGTLPLVPLVHSLGSKVFVYKTECDHVVLCYSKIATIKACPVWFIYRYSIWILRQNEIIQIQICRLVEVFFVMFTLDTAKTTVQTCVAQHAQRTCLAGTWGVTLSMEGPFPQLCCGILRFNWIVKLFYLPFLNWLKLNCTHYWNLILRNWRIFW